MGLNSLDGIIREVKRCTKCSRILNKEGVLGVQCGSLDCCILIIGEAPGRFGADISRVPFSCDKTGDNFEELIKSINWSRKMFFVTNAVLCNPIDKDGNNDTPKNSEIRNCSIYLKQVIELIRPKLIVTLGRSALKALNYIDCHDIVLKEKVAQPCTWNGHTIFPLYHCSPQAFRWRPKEFQLVDYNHLNNYVKAIL